MFISSDHAKGLSITALGVLFISPDTLLIRLVAMDVWTLGLWRGLLQAAGITVVLVCIYRVRTPAIFRAIGWAGLALAVLFALNTLIFLSAIMSTKAANVLVIVATAPLFAAAYSYLFLKEAVAPRTWIAISAAIIGVSLLVWDGLGQGTIFGEAMALLAAILLGAKFAIIRGRRQVNLVPAMVVSGLVYAAIALPMAEFGTVEGGQVLWLLVMGLLVITPAAALTTYGPRFLPAPEASLLTLGETVLGPLWVLLVIGETPTPMGLAGGAVILGALVVNALLGLRSYRKAASGGG
jgi:drug/metabolite transporter (DMT)-like permease